MTEGDVADVLRQTMFVIFRVAGPVLLAALAIGMVMSIVQAVTQINEPTLAFVPKVAVIIGVLMLAGPFMLASLNGYTHALFDRVVLTGGQ